jgi:hypothetical protein
MKTISFGILCFIIFCLFVNTACFSDSIKDKDIYGVKLGESAVGLKEKLLAKNSTFKFYEGTLKKSSLILGSSDSDFPQNEDSLKTLIGITADLKKVNNYKDVFVICYDSNDTILYIYRETLFHDDERPLVQNLYQDLISKYGKETYHESDYKNFVWKYDNSGNLYNSDSLGIPCKGELLPVKFQEGLALNIFVSFRSECNYVIHTFFPIIEWVDYPNRKGYLKDFAMSMVDLVTLKNEIERYRKDKLKDADKVKVDL